MNNCWLNDEWLQGMQQKHHIDMMLFGEIVEDSLFATVHVIQNSKRQRQI